jgi:hypothetical protein
MEKLSKCAKNCLVLYVAGNPFCFKLNFLFNLMVLFSNIRTIGYTDDKGRTVEIKVEDKMKQDTINYQFNLGQKIV